MSIKFQCPGCAKMYVLGEELAGKKAKCKQCGQVMRVPEAGESGTAAEPSARREAASRAPAPSVDVYGLDELPAPKKKSTGGDGILADEPVRPSRASADDEAPPLPRAGYAPLTEGKKKKIEKRAAKVEKTKTSNAGSAAGVSFGTVIAIVLFGMRFYGRVNRAIERHNADPPAVAAPGEAPSGVFLTEPQRPADEKDHRQNAVE